MNITIYRESLDWLMSPTRLDQACIWSFGRHAPPVDIGDDLIFRLDGKPWARAICRQIYKPGKFRCLQHDGSRELKGWKVLWYAIDFEDLRPLKLDKIACASVTRDMMECVVNAFEDGDILSSHPNKQTYNGLLRRGLINSIGELTTEGLRLALRDLTDIRRNDIEHGDAYGGPCCRICGCTDNHGCDAGCMWVEDSTPSLCTACYALLQERSLLTLLPSGNHIAQEVAS